MFRQRPRKRKLSLVTLTPVVVSGVAPTCEEIALQKLEFEVDNTSRVVHWTSEVIRNTNQPLTGSIYNIHLYDDIDICSKFLVGHCGQGLLCPKHHTAWPYLWQLRSKSMGIWITIDLGAQLVLERLYSNPAVAMVTGIYHGFAMPIDLSTMTVQNNPIFDRVRRLSTSTCPTAEFYTLYRYYYEEGDNKWLDYTSQDFVQCIEEGLREHQDEMLFIHGNFRYSLDLVNMVQTNLDSETKRKMRKRPVYQSPILMSEKLRELFVELWLSNSMESFQRQPEVESDYPLTWSITDPDHLIYEKSKVTCANREYARIYTCFHRTMAASKYVILEVFRIQNYFQWKKYSQKKKFMQGKLKETQDGCLERYLFHGTKSDHIEAIFTQNFDPRVSGKNGTFFGKGSYFARDANYSHEYSPVTPEGHHFMFLAKVLVGRTTLGCASYTRPPPLIKNCPSSLLYDSCVNKATDPTVFIIFDNDQFYPYFIIKYQKLCDVIILDS